ncbi:MAG: type IX secretion system protein PorQ [Bacteroidales bacterium]|nr:type IX secretion system protein PorQ [Bacteroidales bacterium]
MGFKIRTLRSFYIAGLFLFSTTIFSQTGGNHSFDFLTLTNSARIAAMGGSWLPAKDGDINNALMNPSFITPEIHNSAALNYINYYAGINYGYAAYSRTFDKAGSFMATMQFINYGKFKEADYTGIQTDNTFSANELALNIGWGRNLTPRWSIGANAKLIYSSLYDDYNAFGVGVDVAASYYIPDDDFTVSVVARNFGYMVNPYVTGNSNWLPFDLAIGISQKLKHLPFRYTIMYNNIQKWDLTYDDPRYWEYDPMTGERSNEKSDIAAFGDKLMRHFVIGGEFTIAKVVAIRGGYNYQRRQELKTETKRGMVGFSWGIGLNFRRFSIDYARSTYHLAGSPNYITFSANIDKLFSKRIAKPKEIKKDTK